MTFVPINDDRFFLSPLDTRLLMDVPFYTEEEYTKSFNGVCLRYPHIFSINLHNEIVEFVTSVSPLLSISVATIIDAACFYYRDLDAGFNVVDDLVSKEKMDAILHTLMLEHYDLETANILLDAQLALLLESSRKMINVVEGIMSRMNVPAILTFGSIYRLDKVDNNNTVYFIRRTPEQVYDELYTDQPTEGSF